jgi:hypothetical protein
MIRFLLVAIAALALGACGGDDKCCKVCRFALAQRISSEGDASNLLQRHRAPDSQGL